MTTTWTRFWKNISQSMLQKRRPIKRPRSAVVPRFEVLEGRVVPAGTLNTTFAGGLLTVTALDDLVNNANNQQNITLTGAGAGNFTLTPNGGETFTGAGAGPFMGVTDIRFNMGLGNDIVSVVAANLSGTMTVMGGDGNNSLLIGPTNNFGNVSVVNGDGNDVLQLSNGINNITANLTINNGVGDSTTLLGNLAADRTTIGGNLTITNGAGFDVLNVSGEFFNVVGALTIANGNGGSNTNIDAAGGVAPVNEVGGAISITNGAGVDAIQFGGAAGTVALHNVAINNGVGSATGASTVAFSAGGVTVTGNLSVVSGDGMDSFSIGSSSFSVTGNLSINHGNGGAGPSGIAIGAAATSTTSIGGTLAIAAALGSDAVVFDGNTVNVHAVSINQGNGDNVVRFDGAANTVTGNLSITNADGADLFEVTADSFDVTGNMTIVNGNGVSTTVIDAANTNSIGGMLSITNGDGADSFSTAGASFEVTGAATAAVRRNSTRPTTTSTAP